MRKILATCGLALCAMQTAQALPLTYDEFIGKWSSNFGMDRLLMHALIQQESGHNPKVCSGVGACGLMQLMPGTARDLGVRNVFDPNENVRGGITYIRSMIKMFNGNVVDGLRAYNWGPGNMRSFLKGRKKFMPRETQEYSERIKRNYYQYGGKGGHFGAGGSAIPGDAPEAGDKNPNTKKSEGRLDPDQSCPMVKLPDFEFDVDKLPPFSTPPIVPPQGPGRTVFDPTKVIVLMQTLQQSQKDFEVMKKTYATLVLTLKALDLLKDVTSIAGFELPTNAPVWGKVDGKGKVYLDVSERVAADSGVSAGGDLGKLNDAAANTTNHAMVEAELAWTQSRCSMNNIASLIAVQPTGWKESKDISNRIAAEQAILMANKAKITSTITMMQAAALAKEGISEKQAVSKWLGK